MHSALLGPEQVAQLEAHSPQTALATSAKVPGRQEVPACAIVLDGGWVGCVEL